MTSDFTPQPHEEAIALIQSKAPVARAVFDAMLPELRGRAFAIAGIEAAGTLQRARDAIAGLPAGKPWAEVKEDVLREISPFFSDEEGAAERRAEVLIRTHGFQAFNAANWRGAQEDTDTTHLQYLATEDSHVRASHIALNGLILPKDDPFWDHHTPPWEWGCRCRIRAINPDLLDEAKAEDAGRPPAGKLVMEGPALEQLRNGTLIREGDNGQMGRFDVTPPKDRAGAGQAFQWHPDDLRLPIGELKLRYDAETWADFEAQAKRTMVMPETTLWNWLHSQPAEKRSRSEIARMDQVTGRKISELESRRIGATDEYAHASPEVIRRDSERFFRGGEKAFGASWADWGAALEAESGRDFATEWRAQVAAAATGRKPLVHEELGPSAPRVAAALRKMLPAGVEVWATESDLYVYRPSALKGLADPNKPLRQQVVANAHNGRWLGYGANRWNEPTVPVEILNPEGRVVSGFSAPREAPEKFAQERADDFTLATGLKYRAKIITRP